MTHPLHSVPLHIVSDAYIFELQKAGGVSRIYREVFPRLCDLDATAVIDLYTFGRLAQPLPTHARIQHKRVLPVLELLPLLRPARRWRPLVVQARQMRLDRLQGSPSSIWHSTYYTAPASWRGKKCVTVYDMIDELFPGSSRQPKMVKSFEEVKREQIGTADAVICISEATRQDVHNLYGIALDRIDVAHLAYSQDVFYPVTKDAPGSPEDEAAHGLLPQKKPFLLYVGARSSYKNFSLLLDAYAQWSRRHEVDLVVVGIPWHPSEKALIEAAKVASSVHLVTGASDAVLRHLYNHSLAFVYPSHYEGFGIPLLEAMACHCPIVASRIPAFVEIAGDYPVYFDPYRVEELLVALDSVIEQGRSHALVARGAKRLAQFSWSKTAATYLRIYQTL